jgi:hypothetical protein
MAVRLSALRTGRPLQPGKFLVLISIRRRVDPRATVQLKGLDQLKNRMTSSEIEPSSLYPNALTNYATAYPNKQPIHSKDHNITITYLSLPGVVIR